MQIYPVNCATVLAVSLGVGTIAETRASSTTKADNQSFLYYCGVRKLLGLVATGTVIVSSSARAEQPLSVVTTNLTS